MWIARNVTIRQQGTGNPSDLAASWDWTHTHTSGYEIKWYYATGVGLSFLGQHETAANDTKISLYTAPEGAYRVWFIVKPISAKHKVKNKDTVYWTADWSSKKIYSLGMDNPPQTPSAPTVEIDAYNKLSMSLDNLDPNGPNIEFQIVTNNTTVSSSGLLPISAGHVAYSCNVSDGAYYKVRCRSQKPGTYTQGTSSKKITTGQYSDWSEYSSSVGTKPVTPSGITRLEARSETSIYAEWDSVIDPSVTYDLEYALKQEYFDDSSNTTIQNGITVNHYLLMDLTSGTEYFFRLRAVTSNGSSGWSDIASVILGKQPAPPTTWSSTTTAMTGEPLKLYWVHNSQDGSYETSAEVELTVDGIIEVHTVPKLLDDSGQNGPYVIDTSQYSEGSVIQWRVRTAGVIPNLYGVYSIMRTVDIYATPSVIMDIKDSLGVSIGLDSSVDMLITSFPFSMTAITSPATQTPIGYFVTIVSNEVYEAADYIGNTKTVNDGEAVYSKYFDTTEQLLIEFDPSIIDLENNVGYTATCIASMNSGLSAEATMDFVVAWTDIQYEPNAELSYDDDNITMAISPFCTDDLDVLVTDVLLSVYRREFDGTFTELASNIESNIFVTDPHPALDYARYRIVAISKLTGSISYNDLPGYPINEKAAVLQWDEDWTNFENPNTNGDEFEAQPWSGSLIRLYYNIDVSDSYASDVELVNYIGRKHPVSYYGTQLESSSDWRVDIDKSDAETLYAIRRLAVWTGDVYVREPSGSGYWASITVSFSQTHNELTIPISISITRVDGGV